MEDTNEMVRSPCISHCCLDDDDICLGCFRHIDEITGWHSADRKGRIAILQNTDVRREERIKK